MIGEPYNPYIIAEAGVNHECDMETAKRQIDLAAEGGASAIKFQFYDAGKLAVKDSPAYWDTDQEPAETQYELFQQYDDFGKDEFRELASYCEDKPVDFLSSVFDREGVEFLAPFMNYVKVASVDMTNVPLLRQVGATGKPVIMSTGGGEAWEIERAVSELRSAGAPEICLLHCVVNYPTPEEEANLARIQSLQQKFPELEIGYSDHTIQDETLENLFIAATLGATVIEKHFTHDQTLPGNDHYHAMESNEIAILRRRLDHLNEVIGSGNINEVDTQDQARNYARRRLVARHEIQEGQTITKEDLIPKRAERGVRPLLYDQVVGSEAQTTIGEDEVLKHGDFKTDTS